MINKLMIALLVIAAAITLSACGKKGDLERPAAVAPDRQVSVPIAFVQQ